MQWTRSGWFWRDMLPGNQVTSDVVIAHATHAITGVPVCLVMGYRGSGYYIKEVWDDWRERLITHAFWIKVDGIWIANGMHELIKDDDDGRYWVNGAILEGANRPGVVVLRGERGWWGRKKIVGEWVRGGSEPEYLAPEVDTPELRGRIKLRWYE